MPLRVELVSRDQRQTLENLIQLYLHEQCKFHPLEIREDGRFPFDDLDAYWQEAGRYPYFIRVRGRIAGFVLVRQIDGLSKKPTFNFSEFFLLETYRRLGIGEEIARILFDQHEGQWQITVHEQNKPARDFLRQTLYRYTGNKFKTSHIPGCEGPVYTFLSPSPKPKEPLPDALVDRLPNGAQTEH